MWIVNKDDQEINYPVETLAQSLIGKMLASDFKHDQLLVLEHLVSNTTAEAFATSCPKEIMTFGFRLGYLYRLFLERNNVTVPEAPATKEIVSADGSGIDESTISSLNEIY